MPLIDIEAMKAKKWLGALFKECTPKCLVVTDGLNYDPLGSFGLTEFVATLRGSTIHGMTPTVITATFNPGAPAPGYDAATQHITNYKFADATHGLTKSRYDVVFILGIYGEGGPRLNQEPGGLAAVTAFMQAGGGVFATGDHEDLGAGLCLEIPRVRNMRRWTLATTPTAGGSDRLTTNLPGRGDVPGSDDEYEFSDQSDQFPQRLYVNFRTAAGGVGSAHPLLQVPAASRAIEVFPDHPHEGECVVPTVLTTKLADNVTDEWPPASGGGPRVAPEAVALTMSYGNAFPGKEAVTPRSFIAICAYDGHAANVGRVATDATWHHFVNINIKPGMSALAGRDLADIKQYYANLATWLMPSSVRMCRRYLIVIEELLRFPLYEELRPLPRKGLEAPQLHAVGATVESALLLRYTRAEVGALVGDLLGEVVDAKTRNGLEQIGREIGALSPRNVGLAALGAFTIAVAQRFNELKEESGASGEKAFAQVGKQAAASAVKLYLNRSRDRLREATALVESVAG